VGSSDDICNDSCARNVIWATVNTFLAWVETRGHRASYEMYDVHNVHDLDRSGAGPISSPIHHTYYIHT
jgi:hypothetical protein